MTTIIHYTKSALESEKALYQYYLSNCDDHEHCADYQETIDALDETLQCGKGWSQSTDTKYILDSSNFINEPNARPLKIADNSIGLNILNNNQ